jgi:hypothetical protein
MIIKLIIISLWIFIAIINSFDFDDSSVIIWLATITIVLCEVQIIFLE